MQNPEVEGNYTTIFKDGSIILNNYWMIFPDDGHGKWYWNEDIRGGVIHWFKPEEEYETHLYYKLPDWELRELVEQAKRAEAYEMYADDVSKMLRAYLMKQGFSTYANMADFEIDTYYKKYKINER